MIHFDGQDKRVIWVGSLPPWRRGWVGEETLSYHHVLPLVDATSGICDYQWVGAPHSSGGEKPKSSEM